jgi:four helix bundle protein
MSVLENGTPILRRGRHVTPSCWLFTKKTSSWPEEEKYGLTGQIRRAAVSSAVNIAEGSAKASRAEFRRYLNISLGSLTEAACLLELARDLHLLDQSTFCELEIARDHAGKLTWGLYRSLK